MKRKLEREKERKNKGLLEEDGEDGEEVEEQEVEPVQVRIQRKIFNTQPFFTLGHKVDKNMWLKGCLKLANLIPVWARIFYN